MLASPSLSQKSDVYAVARHNSMLDWTLCCLLQFFIQGKKISLLQTFAMAVHSTIDLVFRMFSPLICFITLILDLYSGMIWNYSYLLSHSNPPIVQRQLSLSLSILSSSWKLRAARNRVGKPLPRSEPCH